MKTILSTIAALALTASAASAAVLGNTSGPDDSFSITLRFLNDNAASILSLSIDGSTADAGNIVWDSVGSNPAVSTAIVASIDGVDTNFVTFNFNDGDFANGDTFVLRNMDPDFDPGSPGVRIGQLAGVSVTAMLSDGANFIGEFVDDPRPRRGLILQGETIAAVPLPAAGFLLLGGIGAAAAVSRKKRA